MVESEYNSPNQKKNVSGEAILALPADPWLLTGKKPKQVAEPAPGLIARLFSFLWNAFKMVTGISLILIVYRACKTFLYEFTEFRVQNLVSSILRKSTQNSELGAHLDPYLLASELCQVISEYAGSTSSYAGVLHALEKQTIDSIPVPRALARSRVADWTHPHLSTTTYEELFLAPQYVSFLAESKRDGAVYHVDGYVSVTDDCKPLPLVLFYNKVSSSLAELMQGSIREQWQKRLLSGPSVGRSVEAERDMSMDLRALFLSSDLSRLLADEDWKKYIGTSREKADLVRDRPNGTASSDVWRFQGPSGEIVATIAANSRSSISNIDLTFPETATSLECTVSLNAASVYCARLCTYVEKHPAINAYLGPNVKVISAPTYVESVTEGADYTGMVTEMWCTLAGSDAALNLHIKIGKDNQQDGTLPIAPVLAIWAETEDLGRIDVYRNPRERYQHMIERRVSVPIVAAESSQPLIDQLRVLNRDAK